MTGRAGLRIERPARNRIDIARQCAAIGIGNRSRPDRDPGPERDEHTGTEDRGPSFHVTSIQVIMPEAACDSI